MSETMLERRYRLLENRAKELLREAGIPLNPLYHVREHLYAGDRSLPPNLQAKGWQQGTDCIWRDELPEGWWELGLPKNGKATPLQEILLRPYHPDSDPAMAAAFLNRMREYREAVRNGESEAAAMVAASIGELHGRWSWIWEARKGIANGIHTSRGGEEKAAQWKEAHEYWQALAEEIYRKNPNLKKSGLARRVAEKTGDPFNTIRKWIEIPSK
jgi:hypothetical protein